jgi:hypothetical protein
MKRIVEFAFEKETKNTMRFAEVVAGDEPAVIGTLYVQKAALPADAKRLTVTLEVDD